MKSVLPILFFLLFGHLTWGQITRPAKQDAEKMMVYEDTLALLSFLVVNDSLPENRFGACQKLITTLVQSLKTPNSFGYPFERLKSVSILYPPDSSFRIFSWQLYVDTDEYRYYGAIQMNNAQLKLIPLIDRSFEVTNVEKDILTSDKWYGGVYYNIRQFDTGKDKKYLLFGYDAYSFFRKRKFADVLSFNDGKAVFGAPVFIETSPETGERIFRNRLMKEYSAEASFKFNYDESLGMIVFDHLEPIAGTYGQGMVMVPDGTYEGFKLDKGQWIWVEQVFTQTMDEAPIPEPVLNNRKGKDILGKNKKGKG